MNNSPMLMHLVSQMAGQAPVLLVYLFGIILCAARWRRAPRAAMLALIGTGMMLLTTLVTGFLVAYVIANQSSLGLPVGRMGQLLAYVSIGGSILRAAGFALVLAAVFTQREYSGHGFDVTARSTMHSV